MPTRSQKCEKAYREIKKTRTKSTGCVFCSLGDESRKDEIITDHKYFWLVKNIFAYDIWDDQGVIDHIMLVPKRHFESIGEMNNDERLEYATIIGDHDNNGYSSYARSSKNGIKSVPHQHTHLIKLDKNELTFLFYSKNPYILYKKSPRSETSLDK